MSSEDIEVRNSVHNHVGVEKMKKVVKEDEEARRKKWGREREKFAGQPVDR